MLMRVGAVSVIVGLVLALVLGSPFAVVGGGLIAGGGIALAIAMESVLADENLDDAVEAGPSEPGQREVAA